MCQHFDTPSIHIEELRFTGYSPPYRSMSHMSQLRPNTFPVAFASIAINCNLAIVYVVLVVNKIILVNIL